MKTLNILFDNWYVFLCLCAMIAYGADKVFHFSERPSKIEQNSMLEFLKKAVVDAEIEYGRGTGELKLRAVYSMVVNKYHWVALFVPFETFKKMVDEAIDWMNDQIVTNGYIQDYIER